ncbi:MAG: hypothetical protein ACRDWV_10535 [Acidimicrobiales bacterium]
MARGSNGETVAITAGGEHVADVVPAGALEALLETIAVLSDPEALEALRDTEVVVTGTEAIRHLVATRER